MKKLYILFPIATLLTLTALAIPTAPTNSQEKSLNGTRSLPRNTSAASLNSTPLPSPTPLPKRVLLPNNYHIFQTFNNCGPASLSMALSYYGVDRSQKELGEILRPYQNPQGDNDDKSVTLKELAAYAESLGFVSYHRPAGTIETLQSFIAAELPVITRTWLNENEDIGHYRVVKGYDQDKRALIQDDSLQGKDLEYSYESFNNIWSKFNYEYLVLVPQDKVAEAERILGAHTNQQAAWQDALNNAQQSLAADPSDTTARFNLSVAHYNLGNYQQSVHAFETVENRLPFRTLWYQIEPIQAYYQLGEYDKALMIIDSILQNGNRAFSELYLIRGKIYQQQGQIEDAREEFEQAVFYNQNLSAAKEALNSL